MTTGLSEKAKVKEEYELEGLNCSNCAIKIENKVKELDGLEEVELNFATSTLKLVAPETEIASMEHKLQSISDRIEPGVKVKKRGDESPEKDSAASKFSFIWAKKEIFIGAIIFALIMLFTKTNLFAVQLPTPVVIISFLTAYILIGWPVLKAAFFNIGQGQIFDENFLMVIATFGAFAIQEYPEAVAVMLFYMIGELFQERAVNSSRRSIKELMDIKADYANLFVAGQTKQVKPEDLEIDDLIIIKAGEKVPVDGEVISGNSALETSALTGESIPRDVEPGSAVLSGMINLNSLLKVKVKRPYKDSTVKKILDLVENASSKKANTEKFITKFARYYTPAVVAAAAAVSVLPPVFGLGTFSTWFYRALIFLVVSCPCALVVSIPLGFFGGIGLASRNGILIKGGNYLEALNSVTGVVFDKTGTLTEGNFAVREIKSLSQYSQAELLSLAAEVEQFSNHPIATSILEKSQKYQKHDPESNYQEISGGGIKAILAGREILAGNERLMKNNNIKFEKVDQPGTVVYLAENGSYLGYILISDKLKADAEQAISGLKKLGLSNIAMLTGDNKNAAHQIAEQLGLDSYYANLLPDQKVAKVEELLANSQGKLAFVGDGINDAPVLARSDLGIAMGGLGSDAAIEAADIVLMTDEPNKLVTALEIAAETKKLIWQNIVMALGIKAIVMILSILGMASMWLAVFADVGVALLAVFNVMRILKR